MNMRSIRQSLAALTCVALAGCAGLLPSSVAEDQSTEPEPPKSWASAVNFRFSDADAHPDVDYRTRIEFNDGVRTRVVTADDLMNVGEHGERTPWYRLRGTSTTFKVTLEHPGGHRTVAEYPLSVRRDYLYYLGAFVATRKPALGTVPNMAQEPRSYPLNPAVQAQPGDSLWVSYFLNTRNCFDCPQ